MTVFDPAALDDFYGLRILKTPYMTSNERLALLRNLLTGGECRKQTNFQVCSLLEKWPEDQSLEAALDYIEEYLGTLWPPFHWEDSDPRQRICEPSFSSKRVGLWLPVSVLWPKDAQQIRVAMDALQKRIFFGVGDLSMVYHFLMFAERGLQCAQELGCSLSNLDIEIGSLHTKNRIGSHMATMLIFREGVVQMKRVGKSGRGRKAVGRFKDPDDSGWVDLSRTPLPATAGQELMRAFRLQKTP